MWRILKTSAQGVSSCPSFNLLKLIRDNWVLMPTRSHFNFPTRRTLRHENTLRAQWRLQICYAHQVYRWCPKNPWMFLRWLAHSRPVLDRTRWTTCRYGCSSHIPKVPQPLAPKKLQITKSKEGISPFRPSQWILEKEFSTSIVPSMSCIPNHPFLSITKTNIHFWSLFCYPHNAPMKE